MTERNAYAAENIKALRKEKLAARGNIDEKTRALFSQRICESIARSEAFKRAKTVMLYRAVRSEVSLETLRAVSGKRFVFPRCVGKTEMRAFFPPTEDAWTVGAYGIFEPDAARSVIVTPREIDMVVCPCAAFDTAGRRVGMGAGYYDRFLPLCENAVIIAAAFEAQKAECIPAASWDVQMDAVYTERAVYTRQRI